MNEYQEAFPRVHLFDPHCWPVSAGWPADPNPIVDLVSFVHGKQWSCIWITSCRFRNVQMLEVTPRAPEPGLEGWNLPDIDHTEDRWPKGHIHNFLSAGHMTQHFPKHGTCTLKHTHTINKSASTFLSRIKASSHMCPPSFRELYCLHKRSHGNSSHPDSRRRRPASGWRSPVCTDGSGDPPHFLYRHMRRSERHTGRLPPNPLGRSHMLEHKTCMENMNIVTTTSDHREQSL